MRRKTVFRVIVGLIIFLFGVYAVLALRSSPAEDLPFFSCSQDVMVIAHRGGRGLWPENTLYAFERATKLGADVLEMDIHSTADGVLVAMHDDTVDRTTDGSGPIQDFTLEELKKLDAGYDWTDDEEIYPFRGQDITVSTLEEIFNAFPDECMNIEIKQVEPSIVKPFCQMLRDFGHEETVLVGSFDAETVEDFRSECPGVATSTTEPEVRNFFILNTLFLDAVYQGEAEAFQVPEYANNLHVVTRRFVRGAQSSHNMEVHVWTVNEEEEMQRLLGLGVDGLITDYPDRLINLLGR